MATVLADLAGTGDDRARKDEEVAR
jgi:hypothetical protein